MADQQGSQTKLTPFGIIASVVLVLGLVGLGVWLLMGEGGKPWTSETAQSESEVEAADLSNVTTVKEYKYVPADKLPPVKGVSNYAWNQKEKVLKFSYNVWIGWLPIIAANGGTKPNKESIFYKKYGFMVEMVLIDDPITARDAYTSGNVHALWGTEDMMVLFAPELMRDSRTAPRIVQQIDWSSGGDGIVVREEIKTVRDLKGKTIVCAQNSPSEYFITTLLLSAGLNAGDVKMKYTTTAFEAAAAFVADKKIDAVVSWAPDIYNIPKRMPKTRILSTTAEANKVIADVYAFRADFYRDHPEIVKGFVAGVFEGMDYAKQNIEKVAQWMADAYGMKPEDIKGMMGDAHSTNFGENVQFFLNQSNPTNFERTWKNASLVYRELGRIDAPVDFDRVMDFSVIKDLQTKGTFANQKDESQT
ncbi:MAG: ABC transporter substrate-binding protein, partial [Bacteroidota bacterium]